MAYSILNFTGTTESWKKFQPKPQINGATIKIFKANGDELKHIIRNFGNLPYTKEECIWRGEMAQFIYDNL